LADSLLLYEKGPCFFKPKLPREIPFTVSLKNGSPPAEGESEEVVNGGESGPQEFITIRICNYDTCISISKVINQELKLKNVTLEKEFNMREYVVAIINRDIAMDAPILNFPLPDKIQIII
jgi:hypothetical protein